MVILMAQYKAIWPLMKVTLLMSRQFHPTIAQQKEKTGDSLKVIIFMQKLSIHQSRVY